MAAKKVRKLFQVAKELNLGTTTLTEELESQGFEVVKKQMTPIPNDTYEALVKKFAPDQWAALQDSMARQKAEEMDREAQKTREADLEKILDAPVDESSGPAKPSPSVRIVDEDTLKPGTDPDLKEVTEELVQEAPVEAAPEEKKSAPKKSKREAAFRGAFDPADIPAPEAEEVKQVEQPKAKRKTDATQSVRGSVSNEDIIAFQPPPPEPVAVVPVKELFAFENVFTPVKALVKAKRAAAL